MAHVVEHNVPVPMSKAPGVESAAVAPDQVLKLVDVFISSQPGQFINELERYGLDQLPFEVFYQDLIKPVALTLGNMWTEDTADFLGVSVAIERLRLA
ncbi:MAG: hypothetical protein ACRCT6_03720, partial [Notoacmeibacter sp.]